MLLAISQRALFGALGSTAAVAIAALVVGASLAAAFNPMTWAVGAALLLLAPRNR